MSNISLDFLRKNKEKIFDNSKKAFEKKDFRKDDDGLFKVTYDGDGKATVIMRLLPASPEDYKEFGEDAPAIVPLCSYFFQHKPTGRWFTGDSPISIGLPDPVYKLRKMLWDAGYENEARPMRLSRQWLVNVYIVKNANNPSSEGKVFKWAIGKKLFDKIQAAINPPEDLGEEPINVFDLFDAPNLNLIVTKNKVEIGGRDVEVPNYDATTFAKRSGAIAQTDEAIEDIWKQAHNLGEYTKPEYYPTEEEIFENIARVFGKDYVEAIKKDDIGIAKGNSVNTPELEEFEDLEDTLNTQSSVSVDAEEDDSNLDQDIDDILKGME